MRVIKFHTEPSYLIDIYTLQLIEEKIKFHTKLYLFFNFTFIE
jgi:hypothetical protein